MLETKSIGGFQATSLIDFPGKIASVIFLRGCNLDCCYCHNWALSSKTALSLNFILEKIQGRKKVLGGLVITGGEPTFSPDIIQLLIKFRTLGLSIKLDSNGMLPEVLEEILGRKLVDYIALDIKTSSRDYYKLGNIRDAEQALLKSIKLVQKIPHEFRTTLVPGLVCFDDLLYIAQLVQNSTWYLQQFRQMGTRLKCQPYTEETLVSFRDGLRLKTSCQNIFLR